MASGPRLISQCDATTLDVSLLRAAPQRGLNMNIDDEKLLLAEYSHFADGIFKNEEIGERRIEFFLTIATAVLGGIVLLLTSDHQRLSETSIRKFALAGLVSLLLLGIVTFSRILQRDRVTAEYKGIQRYLREQLRKRSISLDEYELPFAVSRHKLLRGGIALIVAVINGVIVAFLVAVWRTGEPATTVIAIGGFFFSFSVHALAISKRASSNERSQVYRAGAGAIIMNDHGQVLAMKRKGTRGAWQLPQGGLKIGESPLDAAFREIEEETGIKSKHLRQLDAKPALLAYELPREDRSEKTGRGQVHYWFLFQFEGTDADISFGDGKEFDRWKWASLQQLASDVVSFKAEVYQGLLKRWPSELGG